MIYEKRNGEWYLRPNKQELEAMERAGSHKADIQRASLTIASCLSTEQARIETRTRALYPSQGSGLTRGQEIGMLPIPECYVPEDIRRRGY